MRQLQKVLQVYIVILLTTSLAIAQESPNPNWVRAVEWNPAGDQIAFATEAGMAEVLNSETGERILALQGESTSPIYTLAWSPDGTRLATAGGARTIQIWDSASGRGLRNLPVRVGSVRSLAWNPDGTQLASASQEGFPENVHIWDVSTGQVVFSPVVGDVLSVAWSPSGNMLAISKFREIQVWDVSIQQNVRTIHTLEYSVALAWSPDGMKIASADTYTPESSAVRIWDVSTSQLLSTLEGHTDVVNSVKWSPTGDRLVTASHDGSVRIWDANSEQVIESYQSNDSVFNATFSPYGGRLAYGVSIPSDVAASSELQTDTAGVVDSLAGGAVQIVVPAPSLERLQAIAAACNAPASVEQLLPSSVAEDQLSTFVGTIEGLPAETIPPGCAADLLAVAQALQNQ